MHARAPTRHVAKNLCVIFPVWTTLRDRVDSRWTGMRPFLYRDATSRFSGVYATRHEHSRRAFTSLYDFTFLRRFSN